MLKWQTLGVTVCRMFKMNYQKQNRIQASTSEALLYGEGFCMYLLWSHEGQLRPMV